MSALLTILMAAVTANSCSPDHQTAFGERQISGISAGAGIEECFSKLEGDTLTIGNSLTERKFVWNGGNLMTASVTDKSAGRTYRTADLAPDFVMPSVSGPGKEGEFFSPCPLFTTCGIIKSMK